MTLAATLDYAKYNSNNSSELSAIMRFRFPSKTSLASYLKSEFRGITKKNKANGNGISESRLEGEVFYINIHIERYKILFGLNSQQRKYYLLHYK